MTRLTPTAVLFDMDGTLIDSSAAVDRIWTLFAERFGLDVAGILASAHGVRMVDTVRKHVPETEVDAVTAEFTELERVDTDGVVAIPGAAALLAALPVPFALVTSAAGVLARTRMAAAGLTVPEVVVAGEDVSAGKPHPDPYLEGARLLGVDPAGVVVFEDAEAGIRAGLAAGMTVVVVGGHTSETTAGLTRVADLTQVVVDGATLEIRD